MLDLHLINEFRPGQVLCRWVASTFAPSVHVRALIDQSWRAAEAGSAAALLFDGPMCRLERYSIESGVLWLCLSPTSYKEFFGTNMSRPQVADREGPAALANPVGLSCAVVSAEGALVLGRRNERVVYYPSRIHPFAGSLEPGDDGPPDVFTDMKRELREELSMDERQIADISCVGLVEDRRLRQPELVFQVQSTWDQREIVQRVDDKEHRACMIVEPEPGQVQKLIRDYTLTPVAVGTVLLWGRRRWGEAWFKDARGVLAGGVAGNPAGSQ